MNSPGCWQEQKVMEASRSGECSPELRAHVAECADCAEVMLVSQFLRCNAESLSGISVPEASAVWHRSVRGSRAEALALATRPIRWVVNVSFAAVIAGVLWVAFIPQRWFSSLLGSISASGQRTLSGTWGSVSLSLGAVTILAALAGAAYILRAEKTHPRPVTT
jgi:hypothetical protein